MATTVRDIIDQARLRHWAFTEVTMPDGAAMLFLTQRQRTLLAQYGASIEGLVNRSAQIGMTVDGLLVGVEADGVTLFLVDTIAPGLPLHLDDAGAPYVDTEDEFIIVDPFGIDGGDNLGIPLPTDFVRLTACVLVLDDNTQVMLDVKEESLRLERNRMPMAFVNGNRLIPQRELATGNAGDIWPRVASIQLSYIGIETFAALTDVVTLPVVLQDALIASLAFNFARQSRSLTAVERNGFRDDERASEARLEDAAQDIVRAGKSVIFRG